MNLSPLQWIRSHRLYAVAILVLALFVLVAFWPGAVEVDTAIVDRGTVRATLLDEGRTRMREVYVMSAPVSGRLLRVVVKPGDMVARGEPLARMTRGVAGFLDPRSDAEARAAVGAAEARERAATAERELAELEAARAETLAVRQLIAVSALDTARARLRSARAAEAVANAELRRARSALLAAGRDGAASTLTLNAPAAGVVLRVLQESEATIAAGTPVVMLGDPLRVDVVAEFLSQEAVRIAPGDRAFIENWGGQGSLASPVEAVVERVEPVARTKVSALGIEEQRTNVILQFVGAPPAALRAHDFRVDVRIVADEARDALRIPLGAVVRQGEGWAVFVVEQGRARLRRVELGAQDEQFRVVTRGLAPGDRVVMFAGADVEDDRRVAVRLP